MTSRSLRRAKRLLIPLAALPLLQTAGCDPASLGIQLGSNLATSLLTGFVSSAASSFVQVLFQTFPGSNLLRAVLSGSGT